jgi:hypothetical protein
MTTKVVAVSRKKYCTDSILQLTSFGRGSVLALNLQVICCRYHISILLLGRYYSIYLMPLHNLSALHFSNIHKCSGLSVLGMRKRDSLSGVDHS